LCLARGADARPADAPSLQHINSTQWTPDIITFNAQTLVRSASSYNQGLFGTNLGTHVLASSPAPGNGTYPLFWVASVDRNTSTAILKVSNAGGKAIPASIALDFAVSSPAKTTVLTAPEPGASNTLDAPNIVVPKAGTASVTNGRAIAHTFPGWSVTVFRMNVKGSL
jgi:alpha-N-arabinofuranosidase